MSAAANETTDLFDPRMSDESRVYVREFLKLARQTDITKVDLELVRQFRDVNVRELNARFQFDSLLISEFNVKNASDGHDIKVVKYEPKEKKNANTPVTVFFHGGGYALGSTATHHLSVARLAEKTKSIWLSVEYRRCPEHPYPIPYSDCRSVLQWTLENK